MWSFSTLIDVKVEPTKNLSINMDHILSDIAGLGTGDDQAVGRGQKKAGVTMTERERDFVVGPDDVAVFAAGHFWNGTSQVNGGTQRRRLVLPTDHVFTNVQPFIAHILQKVRIRSPFQRFCKVR